MIRTLTGTIEAVEDATVVINVHDVGYVVGFPTDTTPVEVGTQLTLHTYLAVRETALDLYGFTDPSERTFFEVLLGAPKIGPKSALQILNQASTTLLYEAATQKDAAYLHQLSGIGKKTCETIVQHLTRKLEQLPATSASIDTETNQAQADAIDALISLGYDPSAARKTVLGLPAKDATVNSLVTQALKQLS